MLLSSISKNELQHRLQKCNLFLQTGEYIVKIQSSLPSVCDGLALMYADYPLCTDNSYADFHVDINPPRNIRRWFRQQVLFAVDGFIPFKPLPLAQAFPMFEWGLNWCVSSRINNQLILHAAVVEKQGYALIMPGSPGSGKSTLCAALVSKGWRLLSDELTLVSLEDGVIRPLPRPISLKNESIDVIKHFSPAAVISDVVADTSKGTVAHMRVPVESVVNAKLSVRPAWLICPKYIDGSEMVLEPMSKGHGLLAMLDNAFNFSSMREYGFNAATRLIDECDCYSFRYSDLYEAIDLFDSLAAEKIISLRSGDD